MRTTLIPIAVAALLVTTVRAGEPKIDPHFGSNHTDPKGYTPEDFAHATQIYSPEELDNAADLIINGKVKTTQDSLEKVDTLAPYQKAGEQPEHVMHAFVQVLHTFKGMTEEDQIDFRYRVTAPGYTGPLGSEHVHLENGQRYRFFLKKDDSGSGYVGVLDGKIDDIDDVESLGPHEADDAPYLATKDALAMARAFYATLNPAPLPSVDYITGVIDSPIWKDGASWRITFLGPGPAQEYNIEVADGKATEWPRND